VKTGVNRGHGVPVTPDERASPIRGRFFADGQRLSPSRISLAIFVVLSHAVVPNGRRPGFPGPSSFSRRHDFLRALSTDAAVRFDADCDRIYPH
jgi:hypothetical protein